MQSSFEKCFTVEKFVFRVFVKVKSKLHNHFSQSFFIKNTKFRKILVVLKTS